MADRQRGNHSSTKLLEDPTKFLEMGPSSERITHYRVDRDRNEDTRGIIESEHIRQKKG